jgi:hypothetical protein
LRQPAAGAGVEIDATAVIARATVAVIKIVLIVKPIKHFETECTTFFEVSAFPSVSLI